MTTRKLTLPQRLVSVRSRSTQAGRPTKSMQATKITQATKATQAPKAVLLMEATRFIKIARSVGMTSFLMAPQVMGMKRSVNMSTGEPEEGCASSLRDLGSLESTTRSHVMCLELSVI